MVWTQILAEIQKYCKSGAIIGLESGNSFTSSDEGIPLTGDECLIIQSIVKNLSTSSPASKIQVGLKQYNLVSTDKDKKRIYYKDNEDNLVICFSKMLIFLGLFDIGKSDSHQGLFFIHEDFIYRGM